MTPTRQCESCGATWCAGCSGNPPNCPVCGAKTIRRLDLETSAPAKPRPQGPDPKPLAQSYSQPGGPRRV